MPNLPFVLLQVVAFFGLPPFLILVGLNRGLRKQDSDAKKSIAFKKPVGVFMEPTNEALPTSLINEFEIIRKTNSLYLTGSDLGLIVNLVRMYPLSFYFVFKISFKIAVYRHSLEKTNCNAILCASEYSFTSSILTLWCERNNIEHINVMHGEKLFDVTNAFSTFHRFYVWNEHYLNLFERLDTKANQFKTEWPQSFQAFRKLDNTIEKTNNVATYFLQSSDHDYLKRVSSALNILNKKWRIVVRPHPRFPLDEAASQILGPIEIQDVSNISVLEAIRNTTAVCGTYSTALLQAYLASKKVILDDISESDLFAKLEDLDYILVAYKCSRLSEYI